MHFRPQHSKRPDSNQCKESREQFSKQSTDDLSRLMQQGNLLKANQPKVEDETLRQIFALIPHLKDSETEDVPIESLASEMEKGGRGVVADCRSMLFAAGFYALVGGGVIAGGVALNGCAAQMAQIDINKDLPEKGKKTLKAKNKDDALEKLAFYLRFDDVEEMEDEYKCKPKKIRKGVYQVRFKLIDEDEDEEDNDEDVDEGELPELDEETRKKMIQFREEVISDLEIKYKQYKKKYGKRKKFKKFKKKVESTIEDYEQEIEDLESGETEKGHFHIYNSTIEEMACRMASGVIRSLAGETKLLKKSERMDSARELLNEDCESEDLDEDEVEDEDWDVEDPDTGIKNFSQLTPKKIETLVNIDKLVLIDAEDRDSHKCQLYEEELKKLKNKLGDEILILKLTKGKKYYKKSLKLLAREIEEFPTTIVINYKAGEGMAFKGAIPYKTVMKALKERGLIGKKSKKKTKKRKIDRSDESEKGESKVFTCISVNPDGQQIETEFSANVPISTYSAYKSMRANNPHNTIINIYPAGIDEDGAIRKAKSRIPSFEAQIKEDEKELTVEKAETIKAIRQSVFERINYHRQKNGLQEVERDTLAEKAAQLYAEEMLRTNTQSHWDSNGRLAYHRLPAVGGTDYVTENVASGVWEGKMLSSRKELMDSAMDRHDFMYNERPPGPTGHRENILLPHHTGVGIGVAFSTNGTLYMAQEFTDSYVKVRKFKRKSKPGKTVKLKGEIIDKGEIDYATVYWEPFPEPMSNEERPEGPYGLPKSKENIRGISNDGERFKMPVKLNRGAGIYTVMLWVKHPDFEKSIPVTHISIEAR